MKAIHTSRLLMRRWAPGDREPFAAMNADPVVMEHFPSLLTRGESDALVDRIEAGLEEHGFGLWALEVVDSGEFVGFTGLSVPGFRAPWMAARHQPVVEVGWRLARSAWGRGYATEAARAATEHAFHTLGLPEVVSFTTVGNARSQAVMRRLGMVRLATYDHPVQGRPPMPSVAFLLRAPGVGGPG